MGTVKKVPNLNSYHSTITCSDQKIPEVGLDSRKSTPLLLITFRNASYFDVPTKSITYRSKVGLQQ